MEAINYSLYENKLNTNDEGKSYLARINSKGYVDEEKLTQMICEKNSTVTKQEVQAVLDLLGEVVKSTIEMGFNVNTKIFKTSLSIRGNFDTTDDEFDEDRHDLVVHVKPTEMFKKKVRRNLSIEKTDMTIPSPAALRLNDYHSNTVNSVITPGHTACFTGQKLQINSEIPEEGIFFVSESNPQGLKADRLISCTAKKAVFNIPEDLPAVREIYDCNWEYFRSKNILCKIKYRLYSRFKFLPITVNHRPSLQLFIRIPYNRLHIFTIHLSVTPLKLLLCSPWSNS